MKEQIIKDMAKALMNSINEKQGHTSMRALAEALYNAGYRKQKEGRWKGAGLGDYYCSLCCATYSGGDEYNFCPNCGAHMRGGV